MGLLNSQDKENIKRALPKNANKIIDVTVARLYIAYPDQNKWTYTGLSGAITLVDDLVGHTFFLKLIDIFGHRGIIWDQELYVNFQYYQDRTFFHTFEIEDCFVGLLFVDIHDAQHFLKRVQKREKYASRKTLLNKNARALTKKINKENANVVKHGPRGESLMGTQRQRYNYEDVEKVPVTKNKAPPPPPPSASNENNLDGDDDYDEPEPVRMAAADFGDHNNSHINNTTKLEGTFNEDDYYNFDDDDLEDTYSTPAKSNTKTPPIGSAPPLPTSEPPSTTNDNNTEPIASSAAATTKHKVPPLPENFAPAKHNVPPPFQPSPGQANNTNQFGVPPPPQQQQTQFGVPPPPQQQQTQFGVPPPPAPQQQQQPAYNNNPFPIPQQQNRPVPQLPSRNNSMNRPLPSLPPRQPYGANNMTMNSNGAAVAPPPPPARRGPAPPPPPHRNATKTAFNTNTPGAMNQRSPSNGSAPPPPPARRGTAPPPPPTRARPVPGAVPTQQMFQPAEQVQPGMSIPMQMPPTTFNTSTPSATPPAPQLPPQMNSSAIPVAPPPPPPQMNANTNSSGAVPPPPPPAFLTQQAAPNGGAPVPPPPPPMGGGMPQANSSGDAANSNFTEASGDPGRDALLASIRSAGGIGALKKVDKSQLDKPSVMLQEARGEPVTTTPSTGGGPPGAAGGQASLADALAAALNQRKNKVGHNEDDYENGDDW